MSAPSHPAAARDGGVLDGWTILRYAHIYEKRGGLEEHLDCVTRELSERNALTTVLVYLTRERDRAGEREEALGRGRLIRVALFAAEGDSAEEDAAAPAPDGPVERLRRAARLRAVGHPLAFRLLAWWQDRRGGPRRRRGEPERAGDCFGPLVERFHPDLVVTHSPGGRDAWELIGAAAAGGVPVAMVNHFANDRFNHLSMRRQAERCTGVAGLTGVGVPGYLGTRFTNLSSGINTDFYNPQAIDGMRAPGARSGILLPARVTPAKGQGDLVRALGRLAERGLRPSLCLAGHVDSAAFQAGLQDLAAALGVRDQVTFAGNLDPVALRAAYAAAAVMAFPTHHPEGLPRVVVEAQAMGTPPVVYDSGGTRSALVDGETGILLRRGDVEGLADALARLLRDAALRDRMGQAGELFVRQQFSLASLARRHEEFYLRMASAC